MKDNQTIKIIGVGSALIDFLAHVEEEFISGIKGEKGGMEYVDPGDIGRKHAVAQCEAE